MPIRVLVPEVTSKIAAGEVIERPSSVVKELLDNSLDAGARRIRIDIRGGGIELIKVSDDGEGVPAGELEMAFKRYATSKISDLDDLGRISSLGFRGEALPSIAAVAEVEIFARADADDVGSFLYLRGGNVAHREKRSRSRGTTISVSRLFQNFPARLKFLKSAGTESSHIVHLVNMYALSFPEVQFTLFRDGHPGLQTAGDGDLGQVMSKVYGQEAARKMLGVMGEEPLIRVTGLTSSLSLSRSNRSYLSFFVNRRWVYSPLLTRATEQAYHGLLMSGKHPVAAVNISLPPQEVDVNVHPAKTQVKFRHEQEVFTAVERAVREALDRMPVAKPKGIVSHNISWQWQNSQVSDSEPVFVTPLLPLKLPVLRVLGQVANTYIVAEGPDGLYIIDQHAAHERIRYDKILAQWSQNQVEAQTLLQPVILELSPGDEEVMKANMDNLAQFGFVVEPFGERSYLLRTVPALLREADIVEAMDALLDDIATGGDTAPWEEKLARSLACHGAIRAGQQLSGDEMRELLRQLEQTRHPRTCPHGRPTVVHINSHQMERDFGRKS